MIEPKRRYACMQWMI